MKLQGKITRTALSLAFVLTSVSLHAQLLKPKQGEKEPICVRIDPPNWYQNMGRDTLQMLFYGDQMKGASVKVITPGFILGENRSTSNSYLLHDLRLDNTFTGTLVLEISQGRKKQIVNYEILPKPDLSPTDKNAPYTLSPSDAMYLIMPDRFKNGDLGNDAVAGMLETPDKKDPFGRHGGDIQGIREGLSYIKDMGYTSIWCTPLWENNQPKQSYHGYACTDHYAPVLSLPVIFPLILVGIKASLKAFNPVLVSSIYTDIYLLCALDLLVLVLTGVLFQSLWKD